MFKDTWIPIIQTNNKYILENLAKEIINKSHFITSTDLKVKNDEILLKINYNNHFSDLPTEYIRSIFQDYLVNQTNDYPLTLIHHPIKIINLVDFKYVKESYIIHTNTYNPYTLRLNPTQKYKEVIREVL